MILEANHNKTWYKGTKVADQVVTLDTRFLVALYEHRREKTLALTCAFQQCGILTSVTQTSLCSLLLSLATRNAVRSVAYQS